MRYFIDVLISLLAGFIVALLIYLVGSNRAGEAILLGIVVTAVLTVVLIYWEHRRQARGDHPNIQPLSPEDRAALEPRLLLERRAARLRFDPQAQDFARRRFEPFETLRAKRFLRRELGEIRRQWATADVEVAGCKPVYHEGAQWTPDVSKVANGTMLSLHCSNMGLLTNIACRVDDQQGMKHQSPRTGHLAHLEVRFKYPQDFDTAPALPSFGEWLEAAWFQPKDEPEIGAIDTGLGWEIVTCRFRVIQTNPAISSRVHI